MKGLDRSVLNSNQSSESEEEVYPEGKSSDLGLGDIEFDNYDEKPTQRFVSSSEELYSYEDIRRQKGKKERSKKKDVNRTSRKKLTGTKSEKRSTRKSSTNRLEKSCATSKKPSDHGRVRQIQPEKRLPWKRVIVFQSSDIEDVGRIPTVNCSKEDGSTTLKNTRERSEERSRKVMKITNASGADLNDYPRQKDNTCQ